jgi:hypothetical protein
MTTTTTITPTIASTGASIGLSTAELETELLSELPEREEMSSAFRFINHHQHEYGCEQQYSYERVWDPCHHRFIIERVVLVTSTIHLGGH